MKPETRQIALEALSPHWTIRVGDDRRPNTSGHTFADMTGAAYVAALGRWAASIAMVREPAAVGEIVSAPWRTLAYKAGDCDDLAAAVAAFACVVGLPTAIVLVHTAPGFAHVACAVGDSWLPQHHGRLSHVIDFDGAKAAPADLTSTHQLYPVSVGL